MSCLARLESIRRHTSLEPLEERTLLDGGLGSEIAAFASQGELEAALLDRAVLQHEWLFDTQAGPWRCEFPGVCPPIYVIVDGDAQDTVQPSAPGGDGGGAGPDYSDTNVQVEGVDEGDVVETDGNFIYILSDQSVSIVDASDPAHPRTTSRVQLDPNSFGREMYLHGDRLLVLSNSWYYDTEPLPLNGGGPVGDFIGGDLLWAPSQSEVVATVIDVSNRNAAEVISRTAIDGALTNSRAIDGTAYLIVDDYLSFPIPETTDVTISNPGEEPRTISVYESEQQYRARVAEIILDVLPSASNYDAFNNPVSQSRLADFDRTYRTVDPNFHSLVSIITIDMHEHVPSVGAGTTVMTNSGHEIFMSTDSLYLFQTKWDATDLTSIMQFEVDTEQKYAIPIASGTVNGRLLDQFSADEKDGQLRIATTTGFGDASSSGVYVLDEVDDQLTVVGQVDKLAPGERIFSARFVGSMAYVVTFRQVDPLFAISLADPENPTVEGELKIPGFSEYLQPIDENHLLAIGRDADPITGRSNALQISLFDVTEATDPRLVDRYTFDSNFAYSIAESDHHAFGYYPEFDTLAIPMSSREGGVWVRREDESRLWIPSQWDENLQVFTVDVDSGFTFAGAIEHPSSVRRSLRIDDAIYSVSYDTLRVNSITDPTQSLGKLHYVPPRRGGVVPLEPSVSDIDLLFEQAGTGEHDPNFDVDGNALVNTDDVAFMVEAVFETHAGDTDLDADVDFNDFLQLAFHFGDSGGWAEGDFDGDQLVTLDDFLILASNYGKEPVVAQPRFRS